MVKRQKVKLNDVSLAAALMSYGHRVLNAGLERDGLMYFEFTSTIELDQSVRRFESNRMYIRAKSYAENISILTNRAQMNA